MSKNVTMYDLLISCPGDIKDEISIIEDAVDKFNQQYAEPLEISIRTRHWSKSSYAQSGGKPQSLLNDQFVNDCDAAVAIFWTRFGTPTDDYYSGTEEEIEYMLNHGKQVFMYFCEKDVPYEKLEGNQKAIIDNFKKQYVDRGIYSTYKTNEEFKDDFFAHLSQHFLCVKKLDSMEKNSPNLTLKSIEHSQVEDIAHVSEYNFEHIQSLEDILNTIKETYKIISNIKVSKKNLNSEMIFASLERDVVIGEQVKYIISEFANKMEIACEDDFFELGGLTENALSGSMVGGRSFHGTKDEEKKYDAIYDLKDLIMEYIDWQKICNCYAGMNCIKLCLCNEGSTYDEDIDVMIKMPSSALLSHKDFLIPDEDTLSSLDKWLSLATLFEIEETQSFLAYRDSCKSSTSNVHLIKPFSILNNGQDYKSEFCNELDDVFDYKLFENDSIITVNLHVDYIKQHSAVAFPTPLFIKEVAPNTIFEYTITSKHNPDIVKGELRIKM